MHILKTTKSTAQATGNFGSKPLSCFRSFLVPYFLMLTIEMPGWLQILFTSRNGRWNGGRRNECDARWKPRFIFEQTMGKQHHGRQYLYPCR